MRECRQSSTCGVHLVLSFTPLVSRRSPPRSRLFVPTEDPRADLEPCISPASQVWRTLPDVMVSALSRVCRGPAEAVQLAHEDCPKKRGDHRCAGRPGTAGARRYATIHWRVGSTPDVAGTSKIVQELAGVAAYVVHRRCPCRPPSARLLGRRGLQGDHDTGAGWWTAAASVAGLATTRPAR